MLSQENKVDRTDDQSSKRNQSSRKVFLQQRTGKSANVVCLSCKCSHFLYQCSGFKAKTVYNRNFEVRQLELCFNCFGNHKFDQCSSKGRCFTCKEKHHTLLHFDSDKKFQLTWRVFIRGTPCEPEQRRNLKSERTHCIRFFPSMLRVILATAQVKV